MTDQDRRKASEKVFEQREAPILTCASCGAEFSIDQGTALNIIIQKLKDNKELMERTKERLTDYSTYEMGNELIRHLSLYREGMKDAR